MKEIKGIKKAVGDYLRANKGGWYDPEYGRLMLDRGTGEVWCDHFYCLGHNEWKIYHDNAIINLGARIMEYGEKVSMKTVKEYAEKLCERYERKQK